MILINYFFDDSLLFYGMLASTTVLYIGYSIYKHKSILNNSESKNEIDYTNPDIISTALDDLDIDFDNMESWWDEAFAEYLEQTTPRSATSGLTEEEHKLKKFYEIVDLYMDDMNINSVIEEDLIEIINLFPIPEFYSSDINELILAIINYWHG